MRSRTPVSELEAGWAKEMTRCTQIRREATPGAERFSGQLKKTPAMPEHAGVEDLTGSGLDRERADFRIRYYCTLTAVLLGAAGGVVSALAAFSASASAFAFSTTA